MVADAGMVSAGNQRAIEAAGLSFILGARIPDVPYVVKTWREKHPTEAVNGQIKKVKRVGHGYRNFANYRLRLLLHCGVDWHTLTATPIRGRLPRLAA